jgi:hypothetical protein
MMMRLLSQRPPKVSARSVVTDRYGITAKGDYLSLPWGHLYVLNKDIRVSVNHKWVTLTISHANDDGWEAFARTPTSMSRAARRRVDL